MMPPARPTPGRRPRQAGAPAVAAGPVAHALVSVLLIEDDLVDEMATLRTVLQEALPYRMQVARSVGEASRV